MKENKNVIEQCASAFIATLSKEELAYCTDKERGDYMGFSALHDLMDANVELMNTIGALSANEKEIKFLNRVIKRIDAKLKGETRDELSQI
jgi:hypothetical protein